ncbi:hypothetical protein ACN6KS_21310 [Paenibacillus nitricinens]|uniref:hypothetical protein n=1 Tax=Paenibacillus nitricinens TaxID=3367691 RepID=UPI003F82F230
MKTTVIDFNDEEIKEYEQMSNRELSEIMSEDNKAFHVLLKRINNGTIENFK